MKNLFLVFSLLLLTVNLSFSQEQIVYDTVDVPAEFPGGRDSLMLFLSRNIHYPQIAVELGIEGKCYTKFVISETGYVTNVKIIKGVPDCQECDAEVLRVLRRMPNWSPATKEGKAVNSYYTMPINFSLGRREKTKKELRKEKRALKKNGYSILNQN